MIVVLAVVTPPVVLCVLVFVWANAPKLAAKASANIVFFMFFPFLFLLSKE
jgi:hypothetical protein